MQVLDRLMPKPGDVLDGRYRIESVLGKGGFGIVYVAWQESLNRRVALKMLLPTALADGEAVERFQREVDLVRRLEHPNTVRIFDRGETSEGLQFYVMELVKGRTLSDVIVDEWPLTPARVRRITEQILKSLGEAHQHGIVHRDLKPGNVIISDVFAETDFVKVLDFGIGKLVAGADQGETLTAGGPIGTPLYMSPEQATEVRDIDGRSDLYALGLIMHEMWTGQRAVDAPSPLEVVLEHVKPDPVQIDPRLTSSPLGQVIWRATLKDREARFGNAMEMLDALQAVAIDEEVAFDRTMQLGSAGPDTTPLLTTLPAAPVATDPSPPARTRRRIPRRLRGVTIVLAIGCVAAIAWSLLSAPGNDDESGNSDTQSSLSAAEPAPSAWAEAAALQFDAGVVQYCWRNNPVPDVPSARIEVTLTFRGQGSAVETIRIEGLEGVDDANFRRCVVTRGHEFRFAGAPDVAELVIRSQLNRH